MTAPTTKPFGDPFETVYNTSLTCESCIKSVTDSIMQNEGVKRVECDLPTQTVSVIASVPPSKIIESIQDTGRDAIIRGVGSPNSAAVCILEDFTTQVNSDTQKSDREVYGLARVVKTRDDESFVDLTLTGMKPNASYFASLRTGGDLSNGALSTGKSLYNFPEIKCDDTGKCVQFSSIPYGIDQLIGRSMTVSTSPRDVFMNSMVGVIARSAGAWENDKYVCSCTGKNIWQERTDAKQRGIDY